MRAETHEVETSSLAPGSGTPRYRPGWLSVFASFVALATFIPTSAHAYNLGAGSIQISPDDPISTADPVSITISLWTPSSSAVLSGPTVWSVTGNTVSIDVFASTLCELSSPFPICDTAVGSVSTSVLLGPLSAGEYTIEVQSHRTSFYGTTPRDFETASFTVVPEPTSALLIGLGLAALAIRRSNKE